MQTEYQLRQRIQNDLTEAAHICMMIELNQTSGERKAAQTVHLNERGFSQSDAPYLQPIADRLWAGTDPRDLSGAEQAILKSYTSKYAAQYLAFAAYYYNLNNPVC